MCTNITNLDVDTVFRLSKYKKKMKNKRENIL